MARTFPPTAKPHIVQTHANSLGNHSHTVHTKTYSRLSAPPPPSPPPTHTFTHTHTYKHIHTDIKTRTHPHSHQHSPLHRVYYRNSSASTRALPLLLCLRLHRHACCSYFQRYHLVCPRGQERWRTSLQICLYRQLLVLFAPAQNMTIGKEHCDKPHPFGFVCRDRCALRPFKTFKLICRSGRCAHYKPAQLT